MKNTSGNIHCKWDSRTSLQSITASALKLSSVSDDMKEGPTLSSMGEIETIYKGGWDHDLHRIRSSQEVDAGSGHRRSGKNHSGDASTQRQQFFERISQGIAETVKGSGRSWTHLGVDL